MRRLIVGTLGFAIGAGLVLPAYADGPGDAGGSLIRSTVNEGGPSDVSASLSVQQVHQGGSDEATTYGGVSREVLSAQAIREAEVVDAGCRELQKDVSDPKTRPDIKVADTQAYKTNCVAGTTPGSYTPPPWVLGSQAVAQLTLPAAKPVVGPDPSLNEWKMAVVGYPLWLSTPGVASMTSSASVMGYTVSLQAVRQSVTFDMGDGGSVTCATSTPWSPEVPPAQPSPDCGYAYQKISKPGSFRIVTSATWQVTWSVLGQSGTIPVTKYGAANLTVGELQSVVVRAGGQ